MIPYPRHRYDALGLASPPRVHDRLKEPLPVDDVEFPQDKDLNIINRRHNMGRGILLWLLGIPLPIVILLVLFLR